MQSIKRMGEWSGFGLGRTPADNVPKDEDDDRHIRFMIGGAGRRLTKEDFLKEIQNLDPKARSEFIQKTDVPPAVKDQAKQEARRLSQPHPVRNPSSRYESHSISPGAPAPRDDDRRRISEDEPGSSNTSSEDRDGRRGSTKAVHVVRRDPETRKTRLQTVARSDESGSPETPAERRRREHVLKGVEDSASPGSEQRRGRSPRKRDDDDSNGGNGAEKETAAEKRRREAALGMRGSTQDDSDDDDTPRVPPPARSRGIRFAESPVRRK